MAATGVGSRNSDFRSQRGTKNWRLATLPPMHYFLEEMFSANALLSDAFIVVNPLLSDAFIVVNALFSDDAIPLMLWKAVMSNLSHLPDRTTWLGFDHTLLPF